MTGRERGPPGIVFLAALAGFGALSVDGFLPLLPGLAASFGLTAGEAQLALGGLMLGMAIGQLAYGPVSDRFGRRGPLLAGIGLFGAASLMASIAHDFEALVFWRFIQGLGASASPVIVRAIIRDLHSRDAAARQLSYMMSLTGVMPIAAPLVAAQLALHGGWRVVPVGMAVFAVAMGLLAAWRLPETLPAGRRAGQSPWRIARFYLDVVRHRVSFGHVATSIVLQTAVLVFVCASPFVMIEGRGVPAELFGFIIMVEVGGLMAGAALNGRLVTRLGSETLIRRALPVLAIAALALVLVAWTDAGGLAGFLVILFLFKTASSFVSMNAIAGALAALPERAGTVSALIGAGQSAAGALAGRYATAVIGTDTLTMTLFMAAFALAAIAVYALMLPRGGPRQAASET